MAKMTVVAVLVLIHKKLNLSNLHTILPVTLSIFSPPTKKVSNKGKAV